MMKIHVICCLFFLIICIRFSDCLRKSKNLACLFDGPTPEPINIETSKLKKPFSPLLIVNFNPINSVRLINTGQSVDAIVADPFTAITSTGNLAYHQVYIFNSFRFYWTNSTHNIVGTTVDGKHGTPFEFGIYMYNIKYGSFDNAKNYCDGLFQLRINVRVGNFTNPLFIPLQEAFKKVKKPGNWVLLPLLELFWFDLNPLFDQSNIGYPGSYYDVSTGNLVKCLTLLKQYLPVQHEISESQFYDAFGGLEANDGQPLVTGGKTYPLYGRPLVRGQFGTPEIPSLLYLPVHPSRVKSKSN